MFPTKKGLLLKQLDSVFCQAHISLKFLFPQVKPLISHACSNTIPETLYSESYTQQHYINCARVIIKRQVV